MAEDTAVRLATMRKDQSAMDAAELEEDNPPRRVATNPVEHALAEALNWRSSNLVVAGGEIGLWMCLAFGLEVAGVQLTSATKAAFLNQVSVLITPLLVHLSGEHVRGVEWAACGMGLLGSSLVAADSVLSSAGSASEGSDIVEHSNEVCVGDEQAAHVLSFVMAVHDTHTSITATCDCRRISMHPTIR